MWLSDEADSPAGWPWGGSSPAASLRGSCVSANFIPRSRLFGTAAVVTNYSSSSEAAACCCWVMSWLLAGVSGDFRSFCCPLSKTFNTNAKETIWSSVWSFFGYISSQDFSVPSVFPSLQHCHNKSCFTDGSILSVRKKQTFKLFSKLLPNLQVKN